MLKIHHQNGQLRATVLCAICYRALERYDEGMVVFRNPIIEGQEPVFITHTTCSGADGVRYLVVNGHRRLPLGEYLALALERLGVCLPAPRL
jgi:hypothetical protein